MYSVNNLQSPSRNNKERSIDYRNARRERYEGDIDVNVLESKCEKLLSDLQLSRQDIDELEQLTLGQSDNPRWKSERKNRLTASYFGCVCVCLRDEETCRCTLVERILQSTKPKLFLKALDYGRKHEKTAIAEYEQVTNTSVRPCGLFVHPEFGYLGASPDGLVGRHGILEVKCPYSARHLTPLQAAEDPDFYCYLTNEDKMKLHTNHQYYYQIQGQLEITDRSYCDFVVRTPFGIHIERIFRDKNVWRKMFPKLEAFFKLDFLPEIVDPRIPRDLPIRSLKFVQD